MNYIKDIIPYISYLWIVIVLVVIWAWFYINHQKNNEKLIAKRHWIEMIPSAVSTLGVLGTFLGITLGLLCFNTQDLTTSIPELLDGLKTAFFTSLAGMIGSLILSKRINNLYDDVTGGVSDIEQAAGIISKSVSDLQSESIRQAQAQAVFYTLVQTIIQKMDVNIETMNANVNSLNTAANNIALQLQGIATSSAAVASTSASIKSGVENIDQAAGIISKSVSDLQSESIRQAQAQAVFYNLVKTITQKMDVNIETMNANINSLNTAANNIALQLQDIATSSAAVASTSASIKSGVENIDNSASSLLTSIGNIEETTKSGAELTKEIHDHVGDMMDHTEAMVSTEDEVSGKITTLTDKLHGEVIDIEDKMKETNSLLERKFDEFSELLKKNNTEVLVEVMKRVTEEVQSQMNALISKLVQENFDQLNKSVEKLNQWQQENKEMIHSLTAQYQQMAENFENTSVSLTKVKEDTQLLVSDGGKLEQIVNSLNEVIVQDEKFKSISTDLQKTADLSKSNMESFDQSTRQLNDWVKKQRNFADAVTVLVKKLEELNEMRNYASTFWEETKDGMNDAVGIVKDGTQQLNRQITGLDQQFYARLSTTLANLDACIQSLITKARNNR